MNKKLDKHTIAAEMSARYAIALMLWREIEELEKNEAILHHQKDYEALHDFRISIRRTRALIGQTKPILDVDRLKPFMQGFKWIGSFTTPVRDLDVLALKLDDYGRTLPDTYRQNLTIIKQFLEQQRALAYETLIRDINSQRYHHLIKDWKKFLSNFLNEDCAATSDDSTLALANKKTWATYKEVLREGRAITDDSPAEALHELRKTCKKLRYLIDFFSDLHPRKSVKQLIRILKKLQDFLGDFQDAEAHLSLLGRYRHHKTLEPTQRIAFLLIVEFLISELHGRENHLRGNFPEVFTLFDQEESHQLMKTLYKP
jgi:CHAD domain-containing protein